MPVAEHRRMLVGLLTAFWVSGSVVSCKQHEENKQAPKPESSSETDETSPSQSPRVGEQVVVEGGIASFWVAQVTGIKGNRVLFTYGPNKAANQAPLAKVYRLSDNASKVPMQRGEPAICRTDEGQWEACQVRAVRPGRMIVLDKSAREREIDPRYVLKPRGITAKNIERVMTERQRTKEFLAQAMAAGSPRRPSGWEPTPGDEVVAARQGNEWRSAKIRRVTPSRIQVVWSDGQPPSDLPYSRVVPVPGKSQGVEAGKFVLVRPPHGTRWRYGKVVEASNGDVLVEEERGGRRRVTDTDVIPLGPE